MKVKLVSAYVSIAETNIWYFLVLLSCICFEMYVQVLERMMNTSSFSPLSLFLSPLSSTVLSFSHSQCSYGFVCMWLMVVFNVLLCIVVLSKRKCVTLGPPPPPPPRPPPPPPLTHTTHTSTHAHTRLHTHARTCILSFSLSGTHTHMVTHTLILLADSFTFISGEKMPLKLCSFTIHVFCIIIM